LELNGLDALKLWRHSGEGEMTKRQTYHLPIELIETIRKYAYLERLKVSEVVNQALREFFKNRKFTR